MIHKKRKLEGKFRAENNGLFKKSYIMSVYKTTVC